MFFGQQKNIKGVVFVDVNENKVYDAQDEPLPNILVSNGKDVVKTDSYGKYTIRIIKNNLLFISKPRGYISKLDKNNTIHFYGNPLTLKKGETLDFPLYPQRENTNLNVALLGDTQVDVMDDIYHVGKLVTEELASNRPDFIVPLGDLSFDNLEMFEPLSQTLGLIGAPIFYVIGNHDINFGEAELEDRDMVFEKNFGPSYYSFEYGQNLFMVLNTVYPLKEGRYEGRIDKNQLAFIKNIVKYKSKEFKAIKIFMHIPLDEIENKEELVVLLQPFREIFIASGHTHTQYHKYHARDNASDIHELVAGAVCGAWWQGSHDSRGIPFAIMDDGTPKGYWLMNISPDKYKLHYKVSGADKNKQMNIWVPEKNEWDTVLNFLNTPYVYANVFAADAFTNVTISFEEGNWVEMEKYEGIAPELLRFYAIQELGRYRSQKLSHLPKPKTKSNHLWRIKIPNSLKKGAYLLKVKALSTKLQLDVNGS